MEQKFHLKYITGLKGIACFFVMFGHYWGIIKYMDSSILDNTFVINILKSPFSIFFSESFWLYLFFLASGYLLSVVNIKTFHSLIVRIIRRFLRFGIPILFSSSIIYFLLHLFGLYNKDTSALFINNWFQTAYSEPLTILDAIRSPFDVIIYGKCLFNSPYWVLRDMFIASILIYVYSYLQSKNMKKNVQLLLKYICLLISGLISLTVVSCIIGMMVAQFRTHDIQQNSSIRRIGRVLLFVTFLVSLKYVAHYTAIPFFALLLLEVPYIEWLNKLLSSTVLQTLGKLSFGIYSFHWPILCSIGAWFILTLNNTGLMYSFLICILISMMATLLISSIFSFTFERLSTKIVDSFTHFIDCEMANVTAQ